MFKTAIAGCGLISTQKHIPILRSLKDEVAIVGICDLNEDNLRKAAVEFKVPNAYKDLTDMISEQRPDLVIVCTPPRTHAELAVQAMEGGAHVLVEKPMAVSVADCDRMVEASVQYGKRLGVMHNQVFNPAVERARSLVSSGSLGEFLGMRVFLSTGVDYMTSRQEHWAHRLPGGVVGETGPHAVYLSLAFLDEVGDVQLRARKLLPEYPWSVAEDIRFDLIADNGMSSVTLTYGSIHMAAELDIICSRALLKLDLQSRTLVKHERPGPYSTMGVIGRSVLGTAYQMVGSLVANAARSAFSRGLDPHYVGMKRFLDYLTGDVDYPATGVDGRQTVAVMEMIVQKMRENAAIRSP